MLVEKPFTMNAAEARTLVAAARARGLFLMEAMWARFLPHMVAVRGCSPTRRARRRRDRHRRPRPVVRPRTPRYRLFAPELGGGALLDLGIYPVSFASMVLGTPDAGRRASRPGLHGRRRADLDAPRYAGRRARRADQRRCAAAGPTRAVIVGTEARIEIDGAVLRADRVHPDPARRRAAAGRPSPFEGAGCGSRPPRSRAACAAGWPRAPSCRWTRPSRSCATMDAVSRSASA